MNEIRRERAKIAKYSANNFLTPRITFISHVADVCERTGADIEGVGKSIGVNLRIDVYFRQTQPGYCGASICEDTGGFGSEHEIVDARIEANQSGNYRMAGHIVDATRGDLSGQTVAVLGLIFKAGTDDDMRAAPSLAVIAKLRSQGACVRADCPGGMENAAGLLPRMRRGSGRDAALSCADVVLVLTSCSEFKQMNLHRVGRLAPGNILIDLRHLCEPKPLMDPASTSISGNLPTVAYDRSAEGCTADKTLRFASAGE